MENQKLSKDEIEKEIATSKLILSLIDVYVPKVKKSLEDKIEKLSKSIDQ